MPQTKISVLFIGLLIFLNTGYGCSGLKNAPVTKNYFDLNIKQPASALNNRNNGASLLVKEFFIDPAFDSQSFIYRVGKNEYLNDYYNEFIHYPSRLITEKIAEKLWHSIYFKPALTAMKNDIDYRLSGKITRLYGDFQDTNTPKAVIEIRMILEEKTGHTFKAVSGRTYLFEEPIASTEAEQLISGWNKGLLKIVEEFIIDSQNPGHHA